MTESTGYQINVLINDDERAAWVRAAAGCPLVAWIRRTCNDAASRDAEVQFHKRKKLVRKGKPVKHKGGKTQHGGSGGGG